ncbi:hypothetical protein E4U55_006118 [Claviceps digitariae]|nr:hypothetical protein E4U55_006118 [Claviceps digitariae]
MTTSLSSTTMSSRQAFESRVEEIKPPKSEINALILDYLTMEGYPNAAARFSREANLQLHQDGLCIHARQVIQNHILKGDIQAGIEALNDFDPEILDEDKALHFSLLRLQLVELIRSCNDTGDIAPALKFATEQLGPRAPTNPRFLEDLERTMALLLFPASGLEPQLAALLDPELRRTAADSVNKAILEKLSTRREAAIRHLVKLRAWAENTARIKSVSLPDKLEIGLRDDGDQGQEQTASVADDINDMIT